MNSFGESVRKLRTNRKIGSRALSRLIGKAETYISQLERGQIKNPDFDAAYQIMKHLGQPEEDIERHLLTIYGIKSPEFIAAWEKKMLEEANMQQEADEAHFKRMEELANNPDYQETLLQQELEAYEQRMNSDPDEETFQDWVDWVEALEKDLNLKIQNIQEKLTFFTDKNLDTFDNVIKNLHELINSMIKEKENYEFFTLLFKRDLTKLNKESKQNIINVVKQEFEKAHHYNGGWGEPPSF